MSGCTRVTPVEEKHPDKGKPNVILIHGYGNILFPESDMVKWSMTELYWSRWIEEAFSDVAVKFIYWDATKRIEEQLGGIVKQFNSHLETDHCPDGCLVFTHSTGGLVIDVLLSRAYESRDKTNDFSQIWDKTIASINIASAGGGVGLANILTDLVMGNCNLLLSALFPFLECGKPASLGAGHDLRPDEARFINHSDYVRSPSLMIAGFGLMMPNLIRLSLMGTNDGLVAMHSSCGGNEFPTSEEKAPESCSSFHAPNGEIKPQKSPALYKYHYPIIMTKEGHVSQLKRGLLNIDFITTKTETLVFYDQDGNAWQEVPREFGDSKHLNIVNDGHHLTDIVGDYFNLRTKRFKEASVSAEGLTRDHFKRNLKAIFTSYQKSLAYPAYSQPLTTKDHALLNPNQSNLIYESFSKPAFSAGIEIPQYILFNSASIPIKVNFLAPKGWSLPDFEYVKAEIVDQDGEVTHKFNLRIRESKKSKRVYQFDFNSKEINYSDESRDVNLKVIFKPKKGKRKSLIKMFKYMNSIASIEEKGQEMADEAHLVIPLKLDVRRSGNYKVTANLFSKTSGKPIAHIIGESFLLESGGTVLLKVDANLLQKENDPGPYILKNIMISRVPDNFDETRMYGNAAGRQFIIEGFELNQYIEQDHINTFEQAKLNRFKRFVDYLK